MDIRDLSETRARKKRLFVVGGKKLAGAGMGAKRSGWLLAVSALLMAVGIYVLLLVYGPVVWLEAQYQVRSVARGMGAEDRGLVGWLVPDLTWDLKAMEFGQDFGIVIPKIFIQDKLVLNVDPTNKDEYLPALAQGIAHAAGTALPGEAGVGYYFAHSSGVGGSSTGFRAKFYLLGKLEPGDGVELYREGEKYIYRVTDKRVVEADEVSFLKAEEGDVRIVLQTCWPVGTSAKRLVVEGERIETGNRN